MMSRETLTRSTLPRVHAAGDRSVLLDCGDLESALFVLEALTTARSAGEFQADEFISAAETVLVRGGDAAYPDRVAVVLRRILDDHGTVRRRTSQAPDVVIPVVYDGADLREIAELTGLSVEDVVRRHAGAEYTVAFSGFAPGFAYLAGGDPSLVVPRKSTPRHRIPAGAVGLADRFTGIYPRESPGGWQLIGHTDLRMWDLDRPDPALLHPGGQVRFEIARERATAAPDRERRSAALGSAVDGVALLEVIEPGLQTLVEDHGRPNLAELGVSASGAADQGALRRANVLVGNPEGAPALELGVGGFACRFLRIAVLALAGAPRRGRIVGPLGTRAAPHGRAFRVNPGEELRLESPSRGVRSMLAVRGGIAAERVLQSSSRDTLAGMGPAPLRAGDVVRVGTRRLGAVGVPGREPRLPAPGDEVVLRVVPGPRDAWFGDAGLERFWDTRWEVSPRSDRVGVRLVGEPVPRSPECAQRELPSEGLASGAIQIPSDGQPVLFLSDRPLTGGYPVIGVVRHDDLDLAAQLPPGARVRFAPVPSPRASASVRPSHEGEAS